MELEVISDNQCLVIKNMEKHRLGIFQNKKCADHIVFEYIGDRKWNVHIIEMKKAVTNQKWDGIKKQFEGALINTLALNGYFENTNIEKIYTYTAFQRDKINALENTNPIEFRARTGEKLPDRSNWNKKVIEILDRKVTHVKIPMKLDGDISVESIKI